MTHDVMIPEALGRRLEANDVRITADYAHARARLAPGVGSRVVALAEGLLCFAAPGFPMNRAVGLGLGGPVAEATLEQVEDFFRAVREPASVGLSPFVHPSLPEQLARRGYQELRVLDVHVRMLEAPDEAGGAREGPVRVTAITPEQRELWAMTVARGFAGREDVPEEDFSARIARVAAVRESVTCYLAWVDGEPAAAGALARVDGVATLFSSSTRAAFRRRGAHAALVRTRLAAAARAGCDVAIVLATPGGASAASVLRGGFRRAYTRRVLNRDL